MDKRSQIQQDEKIIDEESIINDLVSLGFTLNEARV